MHKERRVTLLGGTSQLGFSIVRRVGIQVLTPFCSVHSRYAACEHWPRVNLDDAEALCRVVREWRPDLVLHCAGICDVGKCESWPDFAWTMMHRGLICSGAINATTRVPWARPSNTMSALATPKSADRTATSFITSAPGPPVNFTSRPASA